MDTATLNPPLINSPEKVLALPGLFMLLRAEPVEKGDFPYPFNVIAYDPFFEVGKDAAKSARLAKERYVKQPPYIEVFTPRDKTKATHVSPAMVSFFGGIFGGPGNKADFSKQKWYWAPPTDKSKTDPYKGSIIQQGLWLDFRINLERPDPKDELAPVGGFSTSSLNARIASANQYNTMLLHRVKDGVPSVEFQPEGGNYKYVLEHYATREKLNKLIF